MAHFPTHDENVRQPMDWKRRTEYDAVLTPEEADERFIHEGFTTVVEKPSYGLVRNGDYLVNPANEA